MSAKLLQQMHAALAESGLLMLSDAARPSLVGIVAGGPVKGSWWGHKLGTVMYNLANELGDDADVAMAKLIDGKVTFVARALWPALIGVGRAEADWQLAGLGAAERGLLRQIAA